MLNIYGLRSLADQNLYQMLCACLVYYTQYKRVKFFCDLIGLRPDAVEEMELQQEARNKNKLLTPKSAPTQSHAQQQRVLAQERRGSIVHAKNSPMPEPRWDAQGEGGADEGDQSPAQQSRRFLPV